MRHRKSGRKLGMNQSHRKAMFRNMVTSLLVHQSIQTTEARAKECRRYAERIITIALRAPTAAACDVITDAQAQRHARAKRVHAIRRAKRWIKDEQAIALLFGDYAERFAARPGGYTRVIKTGFRPGDNAEMAIIELVAEAYEPKAAAAVEVAPEEPAAVEDDAPAADSEED